MTFITASNPLSPVEFARYMALVPHATWKSGQGRDYETADVTEHVPGVKRAFFVRLPPGGRMHAHVDAGDCSTDHIVLDTNEACLNWWGTDDDWKADHMKQGWRYTVDRTVRHWATNMGNRPRTHLLVEY